MVNNARSPRAFVRTLRPSTTIRSTATTIDAAARRPPRDRPSLTPTPTRAADDLDGAPLRVALLGCGAVGSEVARLITEQAADLQARVGRPLELVGIAVRRPGPGPARHRPGAVHHRRRRAGRPRRRRPGDRGHRRHRTGPIADPARAGERRVGRHGQQGAAGRGRRDAVRRRRAGRGRPLLRGRGGRRHPDHPAAAGVAGRRRDHLGDRHRQRHHQLHPGQDGQRRRRLRRDAGRGPGAGLRRGRPDRRRRGLRLRRQGRDPGQPGLPHPGHGPPTSTARASPR